MVELKDILEAKASTFLRPREVKRLSRTTHGRAMSLDKEIRYDTYSSALRRAHPVSPSVSKREDRKFWNCLPNPTQRAIRTMNYLPRELKRGKVAAPGQQQRGR